MTRFDRIALTAAVALAALLRLPGIESRGRFDADQGHDMLTLLSLVRDGVVPLLGPKTSVGEFHHGAFYYFLLGPAAAISNADPASVTTFIALLGIGAVALTWWLGREIGGPWAGAIAGLLLAVSPAAIDESTFIWNPNPIGFFAILALATAWRARSGGSSGWWTVSLAAAGAVVQLHVLGVVFFVAMLAIAFVELRRSRSLLAPLVGGLVVVFALFVPLLMHELRTGFTETGAVLDYLRGGENNAGNLPFALFFTLVRVVAWPLVGDVLDVLALAAGLTAITVALAVLALRLTPPGQRPAVRWLIALLAWSTAALAFTVPSLLTIVVGLPNDHYHAFLDPVVVLLIALPLGILFDRSMTAWRSSRRPTSALASAAVVLGVVAVLTTAVLRRPPPVDPDGGWPAMRDAGERVVADATGEGIWLVGLPTFKLPDALKFPIVQADGRLVQSIPILASEGADKSTGRIVIVCDRLFEVAMGAACGGPAEDAWIQGLSDDTGGTTFRLLDRFDASPRTSVSMYEQEVL